MSPPTKQVTCPTCQVSYVAPGTKQGRLRGKICPNGHFHSNYELAIGKVVARRLRKESAAAPYDSSKARDKLRAFELSRSDELEVVLRGIIQSYEGLLDSVKSIPAVHGLLAGRMQLYIELAKKVL